MSTFGEEIRRERELRQISLREVSQATKINMRYLEAMERNDFSHLPGGVFNRGFVRAYCQFIGVDSEAMVNAYILEEQTQTDADGGARDSGLLRGQGGRRASSPGDPVPLLDRSVVRWGIVVLAAVLIAGSIYLYFRLFRDADGPPPPTPTSGPQSGLHGESPEIG